MLYKEVKKLWAEFFALRGSDFGHVLATFAITSRAMGKWMLRLDSAGQKGPEITLEGILIVVEGVVPGGSNSDRANPSSTSVALLPGSTTTKPRFLRTKPCPWHVFVLYGRPRRSSGVA
jgi:hypothetical protein